MGLGKNYWTKKDSEIKALVEEYGIELGGDYDRQKAIPLVIEFEKKLEAGEIIADGDTKKDFIKELAKEQPKLMLTRVIFHNTGENDLPYVFVGHNGKSYYIPKETEVDVPDYILGSCIKDAIEERLIPEQQMNGDIRWITKRIQRFPYSIIKPSFEAGSRK